MTTPLSPDEARALAWLDAHGDELVALIQRLVRIPSENRQPHGSEAACQQVCAEVLRDAGFDVDVYELEDVAGLRDHPLYWPGRHYAGRPNLAARKRGAGGGRSLILTGHIDTVPRGAGAWTRDPFGGEVEGNRLYGRGSNDMKAGVAINLIIARALRELDIALGGDFTVESVIDEEFGGVNGTLAGRVRGYLAEAAVITEPSGLRICPAQRGGRTVHLFFESGAHDERSILSEEMGGGVAAQVARFLSALPEFTAARRAAAPAHPLYAHVNDKVPVSVMKIHTGPWGSEDPMVHATSCRIELLLQAMPGETLDEVDAQFAAWLKAAMPVVPRIEHPLRWLPGSAIDAAEPLVRELAACAGGAPVVGMEAPCDMYVFHQAYGIPAVLWGPSGGNAHMPDEYVELDSVMAAARALLLFVLRWCRAPHGVVQ